MANEIKITEIKILEDEGEGVRISYVPSSTQVLRKGIEYQFTIPITLFTTENERPKPGKGKQS